MALLGDVKATGRVMIRDRLQHGAGVDHVPSQLLIAPVGEERLAVKGGTCP